VASFIHFIPPWGLDAPGAFRVSPHAAAAARALNVSSFVSNTCLDLMDPAEFSNSSPSASLFHDPNLSGPGFIRSGTLEELEELGPDLVAKMTVAFERESEACLAQLRKWLHRPVPDAAALEEIQRAAHKLKGASGSFGALKLQQMCLHLEFWTGGGEEFQILEEQLEAEYNAVVRILNRHIQTSGFRAP
jgi:HPt (histidine-containing phosphotransfer) domain-containing protein